MNQKKHSLSPSFFDEGIDFNKLKIILRKNILWILLILLLTNAFAYLRFVRYTPDVYESSSQLKLDIKNEATGLGLPMFAGDPNLNVLSEEIELIQSMLFLNRAIDSINLEVTYFNKGDFMNFEFYGNPPFFVSYKITEPLLYNTPIFIEENNNQLLLRVGESGEEVKSHYGARTQLPGLELKVTKNRHFNTSDQLNCFFVINSRDVLLNYLSGNLVVEPLNFTANTIRISFKDNNPYKARIIVNKIDSLYLQYSNEQKNLANKQKIEWLANELRHIEKQMEGYENYFENFILQNKTNNLTEDLQKTISALAKIDSQRFELTRHSIELERLNEELKNGDGFFLSVAQYQLFPDIVRQNLERLQQLQLEQDKLKLSYNESTFAFRGRQKEIENIQKKVTNQLAELKITLFRKLSELNQTKNRLEREFANMPDKNTQFNKNQRFYKLYEEFYLMLMQSKSQFEIAQAGSIPDFKILSPATVPGTPISPKKYLIIGIGLVCGLVLNFFFIGILYLANNKITSVHELERLDDIPVLGVIPASRSRYSIKELHVIEYPKSMVSEAIRSLRTNLDFFGLTAPIKTIAVSSTISGEGKSFIARNLGGVIALSRKKVILLDLDMRKAKINQVLPILDPAKGMSTILIRKNTWQECVTKTSLEDFDYIPSGPHPPNPSELLLNGEFNEVLNELKEKYDYVILDTPPVGLVTDGIMAMRKADISIYIFRANYSKKDFLSRLERIISINKFSTITTLLNALPATGESANGYGYYEKEERGKFKSIFKRA